MGLNPKVDKVLQLISVMHDKKSADYASDENRYSNFETSATCAGVTVAEVFKTLIGVKLARLNELEGGKVPNNEAIQDSRMDLATYAVLYASYFMDEPVQYPVLNGSTIDCATGGTSMPPAFNTAHF